MHVIDTIASSGIVSVRDALLARQAAGHRVCRLESGDPSFALPSHIACALERAIRDGHTHYTAGAGIPQLRKAAADKVARENRLVGVEPASVFVTTGAMHGLYVAFRALVTPGLPLRDEVIVPDPTWTETADNVTVAGGLPVPVPLFANGQPLVGPEASPDAWTSAVASAITPRTIAIVVNSPHNPTGLVWTREQLGSVVELASARGLWVLSDEAYEHVLFDENVHVSPGSLGYEKVLSVYSMSKSYAMSGLRLGYLVCPSREIGDRLAKLLRCTNNGVNSATQWAGVAAITGPQDDTQTMVAEYRRRRDLLWAGVSGLPSLEALMPAGAFYLWARIRDPRWTTGWALTNELLQQGVGSAPGEAFGPSGAGCIRFAFACATDHIEEAARRLRAL
jgi:aspartate aminotransferase